MNIKKGDIVKLNTWRHWLSLDDASKTPYVWGGPHGYQLGEVLRTVTGVHDKSQHHADVRWPDGSIVALKEEDLASATADEKDVASDALIPDIGPVDNDVWILVRTSLGNFSMNVIESLPFGGKDAKCKFVLGATRNILSTVNQSDFNIIGTSLSQMDWTERRFGTLYEAAEMVHTIWDLPDMEALPLPLPSFPSIKAASEEAPKVGAAILFFHTPHRLAEFADEKPVTLVM